MKATAGPSRLLVFSLVLFAPLKGALGADQWIAPTPEELHMTADPHAPGAPAIYLNREEITDDRSNLWQIYARIKVLTDGGKDLATIELRELNSSAEGEIKVGAIAGRTIHPDGTIIPFTGKPYEKLIERRHGYKETAKVFTLPEVQTGSIIEYRYQIEYPGNQVMAPTWLIQTNLFTRHAHYVWYSTNGQITIHDRHGDHTLYPPISWTHILPAGVEVKQTESAALGGPQKKFEVTVDDVAPQPEEEYMPPIRSLGYRVLFFYTLYKSQDEFWRETGKDWSGERDKFIGPGPKVQAAVRELIQSTDTDEQKLRKLYAAVQKLENTLYTRQQSRSEDLAQGLGKLKTSDDIWERRRGTDDQLTELFVAMARAAGFKAYVMAVTNRDKNVFFPAFTSLDQLDDYVAIVSIGGKEQFFDPGQPMCPYGQLAWQHSLTQGLRQVERGTTFAGTPSISYKESRTDRIADLVLDEHGAATGIITVTFRGSPALYWRHTWLSGDDTSFRHAMEEYVQAMMPSGADVKLASIQNLQEYEQPLHVSFSVNGSIGSFAGKHMLLPGDIFEFTGHPTFSQATREQPVYFSYAYAISDAVRVKLPPGFTAESVPATESLRLTEDSGNVISAMYSMRGESADGFVTIHRSLLLNEFLFPKDQYPDLHGFFTKFEARDHEPTVLKVATQAASN